MKIPQKLRHELQAVGLAMLYFGGWIAALLLVKKLVLAVVRRHLGEGGLGRVFLTPLPASPKTS